MGIVASTRNNVFYIKFLRPFRILLIPFYAKPIAAVNIIASTNLSVLIKRRSYAGDGFLTTHFVPWDSDEKLLSAYTSSFEDVPLKYKTLRDTLWRAHIVSICANWVKEVQGDFVELGTWYGILAQTIVRNGDLPSSKKMYLVDAFGQAGFQMQGVHKRDNYIEDIYETVKNRFKDLPNVALVRGIVPEILPEIPVDLISFLMIDMNSGVPERLGLEFFWDKISSGGIVYFDDYGQNFPQLRIEIDNFLKDKSEKLMVFPSGQAILIKK